MLIGIVGKPSCGKSTFFKATTQVDVPIASYPFTTIEPNKGTAFVRVKCADSELGVKCNPRFGFCKDGIRYVPVELIDVAGLIPGAHEGKGLGNKFLNDLNQADVLIHIVDASGTTNEKGEPTENHDISKDVRFLENEIDMWYLGILKKGWEKFARQMQQNKVEIEAALAKQLSSFRVTEKIALNSIEKLGLSKSPLDWKEDDLKGLAVELRRATKPILIACNKIDKPGAQENIEKLKKEFSEYAFVPCAADSELALMEASKRGIVEYTPGDPDFKILELEKLNERQKSALDFIRDSVLKKYGTTGTQDVLDGAAFDFLKYIAIFPGGMKKLGDKHGNILPDCFLMPPGITALGFANKIHTDLGKHMLYAWDVRTKQRIGKDHILKNRDVIEIVSAA